MTNKIVNDDESDCYHSEKYRIFLGEMIEKYYDEYYNIHYDKFYETTFNKHYNEKYVDIYDEMYNILYDKFHDELYKDYYLKVFNIEKFIKDVIIRMIEQQIDDEVFEILIKKIKFSFEKKVLKIYQDEYEKCA